MKESQYIALGMLPVELSNGLTSHLKRRYKEVGRPCDKATIAEAQREIEIELLRLGKEATSPYTAPLNEAF